MRRGYRTDNNTLKDYARLAFNSNDLPRDVEHTEAFFRRFLIIPFDETIPEERRNPNLAKEIIASELSGVFNWILEGLVRLLTQNGFSRCDAAKDMVENFRRESDSVAMFIEEEEYGNSTEGTVRLQDLYRSYKTYCQDNGITLLVQTLVLNGSKHTEYATARKVTGGDFH